MSRKYKQVSDGELMHIKQYAKWMCCSCGLVHLVRFETSGNHDLRMWQDQRATSARRRRNSNPSKRHKSK